VPARVYRTGTRLRISAPKAATTPRSGGSSRPHRFRCRCDDLDVDADSILVLRGCGPRGYPAMPEVANMALPRKLLEQGVRDMVRVCDGRMSGTAYGPVVLHVTPEAAVGGPLALVEDGDFIVLDVAARRLELDVPDDVLAQRVPSTAMLDGLANPPGAGSGSTSTTFSRPTPVPTSTSWSGQRLGRQPRVALTPRSTLPGPLALRRGCVRQGYEFLGDSVRDTHLHRRALFARKAGCFFSQSILKPRKILLDCRGDDRHVDVRVAMRNTVARRPHQWPVIAEGPRAQLIGTAGQGFNGRSESRGHGIGDRLVIQVSTRQMLTQNTEVHERIGDEFLVGTPHIGTASPRTYVLTFSRRFDA